MIAPPTIAVARKPEPRSRPWTATTTLIAQARNIGVIIQPACGRLTSPDALDEQRDERVDPEQEHADQEAPGDRRRDRARGRTGRAAGSGRRPAARGHEHDRGAPPPAPGRARPGATEARGPAGSPAGADVEPSVSRSAPGQSIGGDAARGSTSRRRGGPGPRPRRGRTGRSRRRPIATRGCRSVARRAPGPATLETPQTALKSPWTAARSSSVNMSPSIVSTIGPIAPAPSPWTTRIAISSGIEFARPERIEPSANSPRPNRRTCLRPQRSASLP